MRWNRVPFASRAVVEWPIATIGHTESAPYASAKGELAPAPNDGACMLRRLGPTVFAGQAVRVVRAIRFGVPRVATLWLARPRSVS